MAYINQDMKKVIAAKLKPVLAEYGLTGTLSINHHSSITLTLKKGPIDFYGEMRSFYAHDPRSLSENRFVDYDSPLTINRYYITETWSLHTSIVLKEILAALKGADWYDKSDSRSDYFNTAYYIYIEVGNDNSLYQLVPANEVA